MTTKYLLTSPAFTGAIEFVYNETGQLVAYMIGGELTEHQIDKMLNVLPKDEARIMNLNNGVTTIVKKLTDDLSFDRFWNEYNQKIHPNRCKPVWDKMTDGKKVAALAGLPAYERYLKKTNAYKVNPENYLKKEYWLTDWRAL